MKEYVNDMLLFNLDLTLSLYMGVVMALTALAGFSILWGAI